MPSLSSGLISQSLKPISQFAEVAERLGLLRIADVATLSAVRVYQKHLSPRKGFSCAHRRLYGDVSCSQYFRQMVATYGLIDAIPLFQERLQECHQANLSLRAQHLRTGHLRAQHSPQKPVGGNSEDGNSEDEPNTKGKRNGKQRQEPSDNCDYFESCAYVDCSGIDCSDITPNTNSCDQNRDGKLDCRDFNAADCTSVDCGSPDCSSPDCSDCGSFSCDGGDCGGCGS
jgi:putative component of membrane protein insertase Oxa1/YidC/SpoIIIJ protein YidD